MPLARWSMPRAVYALGRWQLHTGRATSIQRDFMRLQLEAWRDHRTELTHAARNVVDAPALEALEVVMVTVPGGFIPQRFSSERDGAHGSLHRELFQRAVDGGHAQRRRVLAGQLEQLLG